MKILYGVVGEGMGHAIRSRVVVDYLISQGHEVEIIASSRAVDYLQKAFPEVHRIHGLHIVTVENRVKKNKTLWSNILAGTAAIPQQIATYFKLVEDFRPEVVVSDFESWSYYYGQLHRIPIISIDNQQFVNRCKHEDAVLEGLRAQFEVARAFIKSKLPFCEHYIVSSVFSAPVRKDKTTLVPPILRPRILEQKPTTGEHLVVYQSVTDSEELITALRKTGLPCRIYGLRKELREPEVDGDLQFMPFSEVGFMEDLASCRGVVSSAGITLMSECIYLHKPLLALPIEGHFEQLLNARYLQHLGYGAMCEKIDERGIAAWLDQLDTYRQNLRAYTQDGNTRLFETLDAQLDRVAADVY